MPNDAYIEQLAGLAGTVPTEAAVYALEPPSSTAVATRLQRLIEAVAEITQRPSDRRSAEVTADRTFVHLPDGGRAVTYHASGAVTVRTGLAPMDALFPEPEPADKLAPRVLKMSERLGLSRWVRAGERLSLERVWRIMAGAGDAQGTTVPPVLCRAVGAFRHYVGDVPIWGPAAVVVSLGGRDALDSVTVHVRSTSGEVVDRVPVLKPEVAARDVMRQMLSLVRGGKQEFTELARPTGFSFGYLSLPKRKAQELLAPVYVATLTTEGDDPMNHLVVVPASEKEYLPVRRVGAAPVVVESRQILPDEHETA
jgi:hypothetical protein